jgi:hypothetical protein
VYQSGINILIKHHVSASLGQPSAISLGIRMFEPRNTLRKCPEPVMLELAEMV